MLRTNSSSGGSSNSSAPHTKMSVSIVTWLARDRERKTFALKLILFQPKFKLDQAVCRSHLAGSTAL
jgi:hypothetical protein